MGDIATYFPHSPDPIKPVCMATGKGGDGVVFSNIEPADATMCFIGRHAIYEAVVALHPGLSLNQVKSALNKESSVKDLEKELKETAATLKRYEAVFKAMEEAGLIVPALE